MTVRSISLAFAALVVLFHVSNPRDASAQAPPLKIGLVSYEQTVIASAEGKKVMHDVQAQFAPRKNELDAFSRQVDLLKAQAETTAALSPTERQARQSTYSQAAKKLEADGKNATDAYNAALTQQLSVVSQKLDPFMHTFASKNGFTAIIDVGGDKANVLWARSDTDISRDLVVAYDASSPASAPARNQAATPISAHAVPARIAVIDFEKEVIASTEAQAVLQETQTKYQPLKTEITSMGTEVENLKKQVPPAGVNDPDRAVRLRVIEQKQKELEKAVESAQAAYNADLQKVFAAVAARFAVSMKNYAAQQGFTLLFDKKPSQDQVIWVAPGVQVAGLGTQGTDIGAPVLQAFNANPNALPNQPRNASAPVPPSPPNPPLTAARTDAASPPAPPAIPSSLRVPRTYALIFATNDYLKWPHLDNPIPDADAIRSTLTTLFGVTVEEVKNPTTDAILRKLNEYLHRKFEPQDQLLIFFSGHGYFDSDLGQGFIVPREAPLPKDDFGHLALLPHDTIMHYVNRIPSRHIVLVIDACFAGTLDRRIADQNFRGAPDADFYARATLPELLERKQDKRTRRYLTSGGKEYVPDGLPGHHSPFVSALLLSLNQAADQKGYATLEDIQLGLGTVTPEPRYGDILNDSDPGADLLLLTPTAVRQLGVAR